MVISVALSEPQLFGGGPVGVRSGPHFGIAGRHQLSECSWVDHQQGWLEGSDALFDVLLGSVRWVQHRRPMYQRMLEEPRLTSWFDAGADWPHPALNEVSSWLSARYGQGLGVLSLNLYRDGSDSVAWHGDRISQSMPEPVVAIISLGPPRPFLLRPKGGGRSRSYGLGWGDLLVMGGRCQQEFDHCVPKQARAAPRMSVMFRPHDEDWAQRPGITTRPVEVSR